MQRSGRCMDKQTERRTDGQRDRPRFASQIMKGAFHPCNNECLENGPENGKKVKVPQQQPPAERLQDQRDGGGLPPEHHACEPLVIGGETIEQVDLFKLLGTTISSDLTWDNNADVVIKKAQQRLYFLRQLKKFGLHSDILAQFYRAVIESVLTFSITVWFGTTTQQQRDRLERIVRTASKIIGRELPSLDSIYASRSLDRAHKILDDASHPAHRLFRLLKSGRRYSSLQGHNRRFLDSYFTQAVRALNG